MAKDQEIVAEHNRSTVVRMCRETLSPQVRVRISKCFPKPTSGRRSPPICRLGSNPETFPKLDVFRYVISGRGFRRWLPRQYPGRRRPEPLRRARSPRRYLVGTKRVDKLSTVVVGSTTDVGMSRPRIPKSELQILQQLWHIGPASVREIHESLPENNRPAYTTVQTLVARLEQKGAITRVKKIGSAHVFRAAFSKQSVQKRLVSDLLELFGGSAVPVMSHLIDAGKLTLADLKEAEERLARTKDQR
jgi:BlaI family transcriptional regulator, penicillinase repressor